MEAAPHTPPDGGVPDEQVDEAPARPDVPFSSFLMQQRGGGLHGELSDALREVVGAVQEHGKAGAIQVTINVKPGAKGTRTLIVSDDVKTKIPRGERPSAMFFADERGNLSREDPAQTSMPFREVPRPAAAAAPREVPRPAAAPKEVDA
jgi:hypothetical protein